MIHGETMIDESLILHAFYTPLPTDKQQYDNGLTKIDLVLGAVYTSKQ